jgi:transcriptional regulator with XRE-family HTH domain
MDVRRLVGHNVRRLRLAKGLTQEQFAERSGFSQQYLSDLERGQRNPTIITIYELAQSLGVELVSLVAPHVREATLTRPRTSNSRR